MSAMATTVRDSVLDRVPRGNRLVAWIGVLLGLLAFFLALPVHGALVRASILLGLLGAFAGVWGVTRGVGRVAWFAIVLGILGGSLASWPRSRA